LLKETLMRVTLDEMIVSLSESLTQMGARVDQLLSAAYATDQADRCDVVAKQQQEIEQHMTAMEALVINVLATQQPVLATDLSIVKGILLASRQLGHVAHEQRDLTHLLDQLDILDSPLPSEVTVVLPEVRQVVTESIAAFLQDDRVLADLTFERVGRLDLALQAVPAPPHPPTVVPAQQLRLFALRRVLDAAREIARAAPLYRYMSLPD
jgi:phosphate uptake regulator